MKIFSVYDSKAEYYAQPQFSENKATALRAFHALCNDMETQISKHPGDYTLFQIGDFDERTGTIKGDEAKTNLGTALEMQTPITNSPKMELVKE